MFPTNHPEQRGMKCCVSEMVHLLTLGMEGYFFLKKSKNWKLKLKLHPNVLV